MTAPVAPIPASYKMPADGGRPMSTEALISDEFMHEVVEGYERGLPDPNDPNDTAQVPAVEPGAPKKAEKTTEAKSPAKVVEALKDGEPAPAKVEPPAPLTLATEFTAYDADGDELDLADVMGKIKEIGIPYKGEVRKMPLDRVVRLAQAGFSNQKVYDEAKSAIESYGTLEADFTAANDSITRQNAFIESLLTDDGRLQQAREKFAQFNSPESRAERAERRTKELEARIAEGSRPAGDSISFFTSDVKPVLAKILTEYPTISEDEVIGRFNRLTAKFGPVIQPKDYPAVKDLVQDLAAWAAGTHEDRATSSTAIRKAKEENTLLKKRVATGARPTGRVATAADGVKPKKPSRPGSDQAIEDMVEAALAGDD